MTQTLEPKWNERLVVPVAVKSVEAEGGAVGEVAVPEPIKLKVYDRDR